MEKEDLLFLNQLVKSLDDAGKSVEFAYEKGSVDEFNKSKKIILRIQKEIEGIIR